MRSCGFRLLLGLVIAVMVCSGAVAAEVKGSRIMPEGKVVVSKDGKTIGVYSKEMPLLEGALMTCKGKCGVKLDDMLLVAEDKSQFSVDTRNNQRILNVQEGTVYFGLTTLPRTVVFQTPDGAFSADEVVLHASAETRMLEGYVKASDGASEMGVLSGGLLPLKTSRGVTTLKPGKRILFRQADMGEEEEGGGAMLENGGLSEGEIGAIVGGSVTVGGGVVTALVNDTDDDDDGSPSTP